MPIYEYICPNCNKKIEVIQSINDSVPICNKCKVDFKKIISKNSFVFIGDGWSRDGYSKKKQKK